MSSELRDSGISVVGDVPWGTHFCHFYETKQDLLDTLVPYFKTGLESNEYCLWVVSDAALITVEDATRALARVVPNLDRQLSEGNIEILSGHQWYFEKNALNLERVRSAWDAKLKRALARGYDGLRASADTFWLAEKDLKEFCHYEKQVDDWVTDRRMNVLCTYPQAKSGAAEILDVLQVHQFATARRQGEWQVIQSPESRQAKTEIKRLNDELQRISRKASEPPFILRFGVAVLAVLVALIINRVLNINLVGAPAMLFLCALMFGAWYGGAKPALLAMPVAVMAFAYYFVTPVNSWAVNVREIPRLSLFVLASLFVISLSAAQKRAAESLRHARDVLAGTVEELKRTNQALRTENAERKLAEAAVRRAEDRIRLVIDTIPTMVWSLEPDGTLDFVNPRWTEYTGLSLEEALTDANSIVYPEDLPEALGKWASNMASGNLHEAEMRLRRVDGQYRWFLVRVSPLRDAHGNIVKWFGVSLDIEDRKKSEIATRALIDAIPHQIWSTTPDGSTDYCNERWRSYTGLQLEDLRGVGWNTTVHPEDRNRVVKAWRESVVNGTPFEQEERCRGNDGTYRWFLSLGVPLRDAGGHIVRWYGTNTDIQDRKRAEMEARVLIDAIPQQIWSGPPEGKNDYVNERWRDETGLGLEDARGDGWLALLHPDDRDRVVKAWEYSVRHGTPYAEEERHRSADGTYRWYLNRGEPLRNNEGEILRWYGTYTDIEDRKRAEEELKREKELLEKIFDNIPAMIGFVGQDGRVKLVNPEWEHSMGWTLQELQEQNVDIFEEAYPDLSYRQEILDFVAASTGEWVDLKIKVRDGRVIDAACAVVRLSDGTRVAIAQDITERKRADEALRKSENLWRTIFNDAAIGIAIVNPEGRPVETNPAFQKILGYTKEELRQLWFVDFTHPDDISKEFPLHQEMIGGKRDHYQMEKRYLRKDGQVRWVNLIASVIPAEQPGEFFGVGMVEDITERKRAEDENRRLLRELAERVKELTALHNAARVLQQEHLDTASVLRKLAELLPPAFQHPEITAARIRLGAVEAASTGFADSPSALHADFMTADGQRGSIEVVYTGTHTPAAESPFLDEERSLINTVADMLRVAYDRRQAEEQLRATSMQMRALSASLSSAREEEGTRIAREIHDELGATLTTLRWDLEELGDELSAVTDLNQAKALRTKVSELMRVSDATVNTVRRIASELHPDALDTLGLGEAIEFHARKFHERTGITVACDCTQDGEKLTPEQATALFRIFQEAMTNILRHAQATSVEIQLKEENDEAIVSITDNGRGITEEEKWNRRSLGLLGMRERAHLLGGDISITGSEGEGTRVVVRIPLTRGTR